MEYKRVNGGDTYLILQSPASGQSSAEISKVCANEDTAIFALTSSLSGMTVTIRGAPSTPLNIQQSFLEEDDQIHSTTSVMLTFCCVSKRAFCCMFRLEFFILLAG
jgi:hypothetical protein